LVHALLSEEFVEGKIETAARIKDSQDDDVLPFTVKAIVARAKPTVRRPGVRSSRLVPRCGKEVILRQNCSILLV
jgi:hypothetical protein